MKKIVLLCLPALLFATSCVDSLDDYNIDPKSATAVPAVTLVSNAQRSLARTINSSSVNLNPFRLYVQYWAQTTYFDESTYNINTRAINANYWTALYRDVLRDLQEARTIINADVLTADDVKDKQLAIIGVLEVYTWSTLVNTFGNVPYTQSLDYLNPTPGYDDAKTIYNDLFTRLDASISTLNTGGSSGFGAGDIYYNGSVTNWLHFANSLKLRLALTIADDDASKAKTLAEQAATSGGANLIVSNSENAQLIFLGDYPNTNPVWEDLIYSGRYDFVGTSTFINRLNELNDPRTGIYFKPSNATGTIRGGTAGASNNYDNFAPPGEKLEDPTLPSVLLSYSEVQFMLAEASERGYTVSGTAAEHYSNAVTASIQEWGGSASAASTYLAQPSVAYSTASGTYKEKIGIQKWIALYNQPTQSWTEYRRLDYPRLTAPAQALSVLPLRLTYPVVEQNLNTTNYNAASTAIGGDQVGTKIFWDKF